MGGVKCKGSACYKLKKDIVGKSHQVIIGDGSFIDKATLHFRGTNNMLRIGEKVRIGPGCSFWMEGKNCSIEIGDHTTMTRDIHINCQEDNTHIHIGQDCMLSNNIIIRTSDSHPIYDTETGQRLNEASSIVIGNHVWIAPNTKIMKGAHICDNCIVGSDTTVSKLFPENSLIIGRPAKVLKTNVRWTREKLF